MDSLIVSTTRLAASFGVSRKSIANLADAGMPKKGKNQFDLDECWRWRYARLDEQVQEQIGSLDIDRENARLRRAQANRQELQLERERGDLISVRDAERGFTKIILAVRGRILELPTQLAPRLVVCKDAEEMQAMIQDDIYKALTELSESEIPTAELQGTPKQRDRRRRAKN